MHQPNEDSWIVCQLGAREHFAIARALSESGMLHSLATDAWVSPESAFGILNRRLRDRNHAGLANTRVKSWTKSLLAFEAVSRLRRTTGWPLVVARNKWFQTRVARYLATIPEPVNATRQPVVFSYSYTALAPFRVAKQQGWRTILGQIDPGPPEERIVTDLQRRYPEYAGDWQAAPADYWACWHEECRLADVVMVNSDWSREALLAEGIPSDKVAVVPLAYDSPSSSARVDRNYPKAFSSQRPLSVLFLGQANIRKGIHDLVRVAETMRSEPVRFDVAGSHGPLPSSLPGNIVFHGPVSRGDVSNWYRKADLFVLPTHSDGFGLTQLEAIAHGLPVVATRRCGAVVDPGRTGWLIDAGSPNQLATAIRQAIATPSTLAEMSAAATKRIEDFSIARLSDKLSRLTIRPTCDSPSGEFVT
jgi:glycosyltransferase involved in cell wall biosynthesis